MTHTSASKLVTIDLDDKNFHKVVDLIGSIVTATDSIKVKSPKKWPRDSFAWHIKAHESRSENSNSSRNTRNSRFMTMDQASTISEKESGIRRRSEGSQDSLGTNHATGRGSYWKRVLKKYEKRNVSLERRRDALVERVHFMECALPSLLMGAASVVNSKTCSHAE